MTIEGLIDLPIDELEKLTDAQLLEHFKAYLPTTRPELAPKAQKKEQQLTMIANPKLVAGMELARKLGIETPSLASLLYKKKK